MNRPRITVFPFIVACAIGLVACASPGAPETAEAMEAPATAPSIDLDSLTEIDPDDAPPWTALSRDVDDTLALSAHYEARGCVRLEYAAAVLADRLGVEDVDAAVANARDRFHTAGWAPTPEGPVLVVQELMDCGSGPLATLVTVFAVDDYDDAASAEWMESYGFIRDEGANLVERVELIDGEAHVTATSLNPPQAFEDDGSAKP